MPASEAPHDAQKIRETTNPTAPTTIRITPIVWILKFVE
jgi:hypothetical protein